jgi:predicted nuclease of predicted toxin-antitoxin system
VSGCVTGGAHKLFGVDAQLPPALAQWLRESFGVNAFSLRELGLRDADDIEIYNAAKRSDAVLVSKDSDFVELVQRLGTPPQLLWVTCGNVTNANLRAIFSVVFDKALELLAAGEAIIEICDPAEAA